MASNGKGKRIDKTYGDIREKRLQFFAEFFRFVLAVGMRYEQGEFPVFNERAKPRFDIVFDGGFHGFFGF